MSEPPRPDWESDLGDAQETGAEQAAKRVGELYAGRSVKQKNRIVAALLAILLGQFGVHKFYLGYNQTAFVMLAVTIIGSIFTFGLAGAVIWVIAIVEGIIYLSRPQAAFDTIYVRGQRDWF